MVQPVTRLLVFLTWLLTLVPALAEPPRGGPPPSLQSPRHLVPKQQWEGTHLNDQLLKHTQPLVTNQGDWEILWKAWRADSIPRIDFSKYFVMVLTVKGRHKVQPLMIVQNGRVFASAWAMGYVCKIYARQDGYNPSHGGWVPIAEPRGPGFGYLLAVVEREGIITVNGEKVQEAQ